MREVFRLLCFLSFAILLLGTGFLGGLQCPLAVELLEQAFEDVPSQEAANIITKEYLDEIELVFQDSFEEFVIS